MKGCGNLSEHQVDIYEWFASLDKSTTVKQRFCNDERINQIVEDIEQVWKKVKYKFPTLKNSKKEYSVWSHVPNLGLRLTMTYSFECDFYNNPSRYCLIGSEAIYNLFECERLVKDAEKQGVELSVSASPNMIFFSTLDASKSKKQKGDIEEDE